jgi:hypothetical protein
MTVSMVDIALATAWRPKPGDKLTGAVAHRDTRTTEYGTYPVVYIAPEGDGPLYAVHAFHTTLKDGLKELAPQRGQFIEIHYLGEKDSGKRVDKEGEPVSYHHYVVVDPDASVDQSDIDWDDVPF